ncbi:MAG: glycosyltransferase family 4 protein [Fimbriiglobus sp.]|nr:glycosyltransferase family 4 protein [Fimbriiglobus sp.]
MFDALRRLGRRAKAAYQRRFDPPDPDTVLRLDDLPRINAILAGAGLPPLAAPPTPDPILGERPLRVYELVPELREALPFALTPAERQQFLGWAVMHSSGIHKVTADQTLALLAHLDRQPDRGLELAYRLNPAWQQAVPDALTGGGWRRLKRHLRAVLGIDGRWLRRARLTTASRLRGRGVNVIAHHDYPSGLQNVTLDLLAALRRAGYATALRDLPVTQRPDPTAPRKLDGEVFPTSIVVSAVNTFPDEWFRTAGLWMRPGVRRVAVWYWEMEEVPAEWVPRLGWADEVWAPTRFTADAFRKAVQVPVKVVTPGFELPAFAPLPRSYFGLTEGRFTVLFTFDMRSVMVRKNPIGLVAAFRKAFPDHAEAELVVKVSNGEHSRENLGQLRAAADAAGVRLIDAFLPRAELLALMDCCDCYASLHFAEGLGLGMAEAMALSKPVVASDYSGNTDFMTADNSYPVRTRRVTIPEDYPPFRAGLIWGEPDLDHAAELLRRVRDRPDEARAKAERGRADVQKLFSPAAYADRVRAALADPA